MLGSLETPTRSSDPDANVDLPMRARESIASVERKVTLARRTLFLTITIQTGVHYYTNASTAYSTAPS